jgi:hypothetical protein
MAAHQAVAQDEDIQAAVTRRLESDRRRRGRTRPRRPVRAVLPPHPAVLALGQLEFFSRRWSRVGWEVDRDATVDLFTDSWRALLVD